MLIEFRVKNFRSFRDMQRFSMMASADQAMPDNVIATEALGHDRLLKSAVIYGANASGKSNLISALGFMADFVSGSDGRKPNEPIPVQAFRLDVAHETSPSTFEAVFIKNGVRYQYGFSVDQRRVHEEWLLAYPKRVAQQWFRRTPKPDSGESEWYFGSHFRGDKERLARLTRPGNLFLSVAAQFNQKQIEDVYDWFTGELRVITAAQLQNEEYFEKISAVLAMGSQRLTDSLARLLRIADLGITDFVTEEKKRSEASLPAGLSDEFRARLLKGTDYRIQMRHRTQEEPSGGMLFPIEDESLGTRRLFGLGAPLWQVLTYGSSLAVDELDSSLHPHLVRSIVGLFHGADSNKENAQLIFNTHDTTLLDADIFRRDQVWFVEKDDAGASHLYPLLEYRPRKDEALGKGYLRGRYGAVPFLDGKWEGFYRDVEK